VVKNNLPSAALCFHAAHFTILMSNLPFRKWTTLSIHQYLLTTIPGAVREVFLRGFDSALTVNRLNLIPCLTLLKRHTLTKFSQLVDIVVYDRPGKRYRFTIIYQLLSPAYGNRAACLLETDELTDLPSVTPLYPGAGWLEREVWDMFGIFFTRNLDLRRILTDYGFSGFPLRKDFPLTGFMEVFYSDEQKRVIYQPVELSQEFRNFNYSSPWET
jgi:NADH:ubiquinone oxidoreductase subunit C